MALQPTRSLPLPKGFDGTRPELWKEFSVKLKAYLDIQEPDFSNYMDAATLVDAPLTDEVYTRDADGQRILDERVVRVSRRLKYLLITLCTGPPLTIVTSTVTQNGFELWRLLSLRYAPDPVSSHYGTFNRYWNHPCRKHASKMLLHTGKQMWQGGNVMLEQSYQIL